MGVYIKGVTKSQLMKVIINSTEFMPDDFEVIEVKTPHGRLIDGDRFYEEFEPNSWSEGMAVSTYIKKALTVIEAEVE